MPGTADCKRQEGRHQHYRPGRLDSTQARRQQGAVKAALTSNNRPMLGLSSGLVHPRSAPSDTSLRCRSEYPWAVSNPQTNIWKACWGPPLTSSNLVWSASAFTRRSPSHFPSIGTCGARLRIAVGEDRPVERIALLRERGRAVGAGVDRAAADARAVGHRDHDRLSGGRLATYAIRSAATHRRRSSSPCPAWARSSGPNS